MVVSSNDVSERVANYVVHMYLPMYLPNIFLMEMRDTQ